MLDKVNSYLNGFPFLRSLFEKQSTALSSHFCSLTINSLDVSLACANNLTGRLEIEWCDSFSYSKVKSLESTLSNVVKTHHLKGTPCTWVLTPNHYQLLLLDALPVAAAEFQAAIRWKIKELLPFPIEDAVIDYFPVPIQKGNDLKKMIMVVVSRLSYLQPIAEIIEASGLVLSTIDIYDLCLRNITSLFETDEKNSALIYMQGKFTQLIVTRQKALFLSRQLEFGIDALTTMSVHETNSYLDRLGLEIQRSFDYYQSQWRHPLPTRIFLTVSKGTPAHITSHLSQRLTIPIQTLNLKDLIASQQPLPIEKQGKFLPIIGGLLRDESHDAATD